MLKREENELLTRTGPGTPMGRLMRRYWIPFLFAHQLETPDGPPLRVKVLGENLVAFRATDGRVGLVDERCPHRNASMFFGRNEEHGLRCVYHGWKFDLTGQCVDMPSEPPESNFKRKVRIEAYPCLERGGVLWAYMGPPELQPGFPDLEWTMLPPAHRHATRHIQECNWFQGFEGGFDSSHLAFLHRGDIVAGNRPVPRLYHPVATESGMLFGSSTFEDNGVPRWSVEVALMPFHKLIAQQPGRPNGTHIWVPIDDENCMIYSIEYLAERPLVAPDIDRSADYRYIHTENLPGSDRSIRNKDNNYLIDRAKQKSGTSFTGFHGFGIQDCGIQESMGPISDRTREHLGVSDIHLIQLRKFMLRAIKEHEAGGEPPGLDPRDHYARSAIFNAPAGAPFEAAARASARAPEARAPEAVRREE